MADSKPLLLIPTDLEHSLRPKMRWVRRMSKIEPVYSLCSVFTLSSLTCAYLLYDLIPGKAFICLMSFSCCVGCVLYVVYKSTLYVIRERGILSIIPSYVADPAKHYLLKTSWLDILYSIKTQNLTKLTDFIVSLTLPFNKKQRKQVVKTLPRHMQRRLKKRGLVYSLPHFFQKLLFPDDLFKPTLSSAAIVIGSEDDFQRNQRPHKRNLSSGSSDGLTNDNLRRHNALLEAADPGMSSLALRRNSIAALSRIGSAVSLGDLQDSTTGPVFSGLLDDRMQQISWKIMTNMWKKPFGNFTTKQLMYSASGSGLIILYLIIRNPALKRILFKSGFFVFVFALVLIGGGSGVGLFFRMRGKK